MKYSRYFIPLNILLVMTYLCEMVIPYVFSNFIDAITTTSSRDLITVSIIIIMVATASLLISSYFKDIFSSITLSKVCHDFLNEIDQKLENMPLSETKKHNPSYLNERIFNDIITTVTFSVDNLVTAIIKIISTVVLLALIGSIHVYMLIIVMLTLIMNSLGIFVMNKLLYKKGYAYRDAHTVYYAANTDRLSNIKETAIHSWYNISGDQLNRAFTDMLKHKLGFTKVMASLNNIGQFTKNLTLILTMILGGKLFIENQISIGQLVLITTYTNMCLINSEFFLKLGQSYQHAKICFSRLEEFLDVKDEHNGDKSIETVHSIKVQDLSFSYPGKPKLYSDMSLEFHKGSIYCLKGKNGEGKSTLLDLLLGLNYDYEGQIYYNDVNVLDLDMKSLREKKISVVLQEPQLQRLTIKENMLRGIKHFDSSLLTRFNKIFETDQLLHTEEPLTLSGGEKQKISVIRGLLKHSDILILDEPVSAMDTLGIKMLKNELETLKKDKIILFISHNEELFDIVDAFIDLSKKAS